MNICTKCNISKPEDQYEKYWHSTQGKIRTRRICRTCISIQKKKYREMVKLNKIIQPVIPEPQPDPFENHPDYKMCGNCKIWKNLKEKFYTKNGKHKYSYCDVCRKEKGEEERMKYIEEKMGGERVLKQPNTYMNDLQRNTLFMLMESMGWTFNDNGVWSKPGIKNKDKNWVKVKSK